MCYRIASIDLLKEARRVTLDHEADIAVRVERPTPMHVEGCQAVHAMVTVPISVTLLGRAPHPITGRGRLAGLCARAVS